MYILLHIKKTLLHTLLCLFLKSPKTFSVSSIEITRDQHLKEVFVLTFNTFYHFSRRKSILRALLNFPKAFFPGYLSSSKQHPQQVLHKYWPKLFWKFVFLVHSTWTSSKSGIKKHNMKCVYKMQLIHQKSGRGNGIPNFLTLCHIITQKTVLNRLLPNI